MPLLLLRDDVNARTKMVVRKRSPGFKNVVWYAFLRVEAEDGVWLWCFHPQFCRSVVSVRAWQPGMLS